MSELVPMEAQVDREADFSGRVDARFPYTNLRAAARLLREAESIGTNCIMMLAFEVASPPRNTRFIAREMVRFLDDTKRMLSPVLREVVCAAQQRVKGRRLSPGSARRLQAKIAPLRGQYSALAIVTSIVAYEALEEIEAEEDRIRAEWEK